MSDTDRPGPQGAGGNGHRSPGDARWSPEEGQLPRWVAEALARVAPPTKVAEASALLLAAAERFAEGRHEEAHAAAGEAKVLAPRDATIREILALSAYRLARWDEALRELRTFRRLTGETTHLPVEMDVLRALDRPDDVEGAWLRLQELGGDEDTMAEGRVVYGAFLIDRGQARKAWDVANPGKLGSQPSEAELRVWYVAATAAARLGDGGTAATIADHIDRNDAGFPGMGELRALIG